MTNGRLLALAFLIAVIWVISVGLKGRLWSTPPADSAPVAQAPTTRPATTRKSLVGKPVFRITRAKSVAHPTTNPVETAEETDPEPIVPLQAARVALGYVGVDATAEEMWTVAINDPDLSADDRRNLIEDLNETGFSDPRNLTLEDLPVVERRLELIRTLSPDAMDATNAAAFTEAQKDLLVLRERLIVLQEQERQRQEAQQMEQPTDAPPAGQ